MHGREFVVDAAQCTEHVLRMMPWRFVLKFVVGFKKNSKNLLLVLCLIHAKLRGMRLYVFVLAWFVCLASALAQTLTWDDCREEAARNNPELRSAMESVAQAQAQYRARWGVFFPAIQASGGYDQTGRNNETSESSSWRAGASQNLFSGFRDSARLQAAAAAVESARCRLERRHAEVSYELAQAFAALLFAQDWAELSAQISERRRENLRLVDLRFHEGREHKGSLLRSQAFARQSEYEVAKAGRDIRVARESLAKAMGMSGAAALVLKGDWQILPVEDSVVVPDLIEAVPEYRLARAEQRQTRAALTVARSEDYPSVDLDGSIGRSGSGWPPDNEQWSVGVSLSWVLFRGGQTWNTISAAQAADRAAEADVRATYLAVRADLEQSHGSLADATENVEVQEQFLEAAEVRAQIARSQYSNGLLSFQDWDTIENDLMDKQKAMLQSRRLAFLARAAWLRTLGASALQ